MKREEFEDSIRQCNHEITEIREKMARVCELFRKGLENDLEEKGIVPMTLVRAHGREYYYSGIAMHGTMPFMEEYLCLPSGKPSKRTRMACTIYEASEVEKL